MPWVDADKRVRLRALASDRDGPLLFRFEGAVRFVPLVICGGFFVATVLLSAFGPIDWHIDHPGPLYGFLAACTAALVGGYSVAVLRRERGSAGQREPLHGSAVVIVGATLFLALYLPATHATTGHWYPDVIGGLRDAGKAYANSKAAEDGAHIALYLRMLVAPATILVLPVTMFFWPRLSTMARVLGILCATLTLALTVAQGINKGVADLCGYALLFLALLASTSTRRAHRGRLLRALLGMVLVAGIFLSYYAVTMNSRVGADQASVGTAKDTTDDAMKATAMQGVATERKGHVFYQLTPDAIEGEGVLFTSYLTHGYRGLSLAMEEDFTPTYGLGFSEFYRHNLMRAAGEVDQEEVLEERTYPGKLIDEGWPDGLVWSTFFVHPASDIGFPGVVVLMGLIGFLFGLSWRDALVRRDPLACGVAFHLCVLVFYLPANNQLFQGGELAIGFTVLTVAWLVLRRRVSPAGARGGDEDRVLVPADTRRA